MDSGAGPLCLLGNRRRLPAGSPGSKARLRKGLARATTRSRLSCRVLASDLSVRAWYMAADTYLADERDVVALHPPGDAGLLHCGQCPGELLDSGRAL